MNRRRALTVFLYVLAAAVAAAVLTTAVVSALTLAQIRDTQLDGTPLGRKLLVSSDQILSCTTPGQPCYERSQKQTAGAVGSLAEGARMAAAAAAACANSPGIVGYPAIKGCVDRTLAEQRER
ncbi:MAG: hypothetical protein ABIO67_00180 [Mycobacteriales bacterium]